MTSGAIIPEAAANDIINYPDKGQARYEEFTSGRFSSLSLGSHTSAEAKAIYNVGKG